MAETTPPKVFISYAWEDDLKTWVLEFATRLRSDGINAILDQWETVPGDQLPEFMERSVRESDFVVFVCTPTYKRKSDRRKGGVGYEGHIITGEVFQKNNHRKFIPVLRKGKWSTAAPSWATSKLFIDFRGEPYGEASYQQLLNTLFGKSPTAPPLRDDSLREKLEREAAEKVAQERANREKAEREVAEKARLEAEEQAERERVAKENREKARLEDEENAKRKVAKEKAKLEAEKNSVTNIQPEILKRLPAQGYKPDKDISIAQKSKTENPKPTSIKVQRKPNMSILVALIGLAGITIAVLLNLPIVENWLTPSPISTVPIMATSETPSATLNAIDLETPTSVQGIPTISTVPIPSETQIATGYQIGYMRNDGNNLDLYVVNSSGDTSKVAVGLGPSFAVSDNGQYVAESKDGIIYAVNALTGEQIPLINSVYQRTYSNLTWSPSGAYVFSTVNGYFSTGYYGYNYEGYSWIKYYVLSTSNLELMEVANRSGYHLIKNILWSPDGKIVAYWESGDIFTFNVETKQINNITRTGLVNEVPFAWSPDGKSLLFSSKNSNSIFLLDLETRAITPLVNDLDEGVQNIVWSRDGKMVAYSTRNFPYKIYIYDTRNSENIFLVEGTYPIWSPDDAKLLFLSRGDIFVVNADGTNQINITNSPTATESSPFWLNSSASFAIQTDEIVSENFGSNYIYCTWGREASGEWQETQCSCSGNYCTCTEIHYASRTNKTEMHRFSSRTREKSEVDKNIRDFSGSCQ